ncbi:MAG: helix-turn-helix transcriptional regulator [Candidatus Hadarchaeum sp.]
MDVMSILKETRAAIFYHLLNKDCTAIELKKKLAINESAIRRHLDVLERDGLVSHYFQRTSIGRPKKMYRVTPLGKKLLPKKTDVLFSLLVRKIMATYGEVTLKSMIVGISDDLAASFLSLVKYRQPENVEKRLKEIVRFFDDFGFFASISKHDTEYSISYKNCVFRDVLPELGGALCEMHRRTVVKMLGTGDIKLEKCIARGDSFCSQRIVIKRSKHTSRSNDGKSQSSGDEHADDRSFRCDKST